MYLSHRRELRTKISRISSRNRQRSRRRFEPLENRRLLTTFNVNTTIDRVIDTGLTTLATPFGNGGKLTLREAIYLANLDTGPQSDTVVLKANSTYKITVAGANEDGDMTGDFDIIRNLKITKTGSGTDPIINGNGLDRVFDLPNSVDGISLTLNHLIITGGIADGTAGFGGGVRADGQNDTLVFMNTSVKNNISTSPSGGIGGGVFNDSGNITLINSHVDNNSAAAGVFGRGGGIYMDDGSGMLTIINSTVKNNSAYSGGGGIYIVAANALTVTNSQINNNHSGDEGAGGALFQANSITITGSTFSGNTTSGVGGAIETDSTTLINVAKSVFSNNSATSDGGAIWADEAPISISGSTFANNTSTSGNGGALGDVGAVQVTDSTFNHNVANGHGGAIDQETTDDITILRSTFTKNSSLTDGGGAIFSVGSLKTIGVTDSKFTYNSAVESGGAIDSTGDGVIVLRSTFDHNSVSDGNGGAIDEGNVSSTIDVTDSIFTYNTSKADGGAFNSEGGRIFVTRGFISRNTATNGQGGGFSDEGIGGDDITITDSTIDGNTAGGNGGGFTVNGATLTMSGSTVSNNRSGSDGGGAYIATTGINANPYPGDLNDGSLIINSTFSCNGAADAGGGIEFEGDGDLTIINDTIAFNASMFGGGIVQSSGNGTIHIGSTIVALNIAPDGPDIHDFQPQPFDDLGHSLFFSLLGQNNAGISTAIVANNRNADDDIIGLDPKLGPLANNGGPTKTLALLAGSPAINAADDTLAPSTDQRGVHRHGPHADIGAYEKS